MNKLYGIIVFAILLISIFSFNASYSQLFSKQDYYEIYSYDYYDLDKIDIQIIGKKFSSDETSDWIILKIEVTNNDINNFNTNGDFHSIKDSKGRTFESGFFSLDFFEIEPEDWCLLPAITEAGFKEVFNLCFEVPQDFVSSEDSDRWDFEYIVYDYSANWCEKNDGCKSKHFKLEPKAQAEIVSDETQKIPEWVRNIFIWYGENKISEDELLDAIQFLIDKGILRT